MYPDVPMAASMERAGFAVNARIMRWGDPYAQGRGGKELEGWLSQRRSLEILTFYVLVNLSSGNWIGEYETESAALAAVWDVVTVRGQDAVAALGLGCQDDTGVRLIAEGEELVALATAVARP